MDYGFEGTIKYKAGLLIFMALEDRPKSRRSNLIEPENTTESPQKKGKSLVELLVGDSDLATLAQKFNLDPEMSDKIFIPLLSLFVM